MAKPPKSPTGDASVRKALALYQAVLKQETAQPLTALAAQMDIPTSTAYRLLQPFVEAGFLARPQRQTYMPGGNLHALAQQTPAKDLLVASARPVLSALAKQWGRPAHLGIFEGDMVTYLVKAGPDNDRVFTQEGIQLEAYCSGIGKVLLTRLSEAERARYLAAGPFVALTPATKTGAADIKAELDTVAQQGYGVDFEEVQTGLACLAVALPGPTFPLPAAISISDVKGLLSTKKDKADLIAAANAAASEIADRAGILP